MTGVRLARVAAALALFLICTSCGETYRPVATPVIPNPPNPGFSHVVMVINGNGDNNPGSSTTINVSGDTAVSQSSLGLVPVHAALLLGGTLAYAADSLDDTVSGYFTSIPTPVKTISLPSSCGSPPCSKPVFVATSESLTIYVANSGDGTENATVHVAKSLGGTVLAISASSNGIENSIPVGINPVAMAELPNTQKLYVANAGNGAGNGSVTSINTIDRTVNPPIKNLNNSNAVWISPVWVASRSDSARAYVLDSGAGTVSAIDTSSDTVVGSASVGVGANFMLYDPTRDRLYVTNPVSGTVSMLEASTDSLTSLSGPVTVPHPLSLAALADGSRVYVSGVSVSGGVVTSRVTVIDAAEGNIRSTIPLTSVPQACTSTAFELFTVASADSSRVYVGNCDAGNTAIIQTSDDTLLLQLSAPVSAKPPTTDGGPPPPQNPVFVLAGP